MRLLSSLKALDISNSWHFSLLKQFTALNLSGRLGTRIIDTYHFMRSSQYRYIIYIIPILY